MCRVSDKIKFCTCATTPVEKLKHYWKLYRYNENKNIILLGLPIFRDTSSPAYVINYDILTQRLNEMDAFDKPIEFQENDRLEILINNGKQDGEMLFNFKYENGKWIADNASPFELENDYDELAKGRFKKVKQKNV